MIFKNHARNRKEVILDLDSKILVIQIPKTGSTSVLNSFMRNHPEKVRNFNCYRHEGIEYFNEQIKDLNRYDVYAMIRNPIAQSTSYYVHTFRRKENKRYSGNIYDEKNIDIFIESCIKKRNAHLIQSRYITINGKIPIFVKVFKFEDGMNDFISYLNEKHNLQLKTIHSNKLQDYDSNKIQTYNFKRSIEKYMEEEFTKLNYNRNEF